MKWVKTRPQRGLKMEANRVWQDLRAPGLAVIHSAWIRGPDGYSLKLVSVDLYGTYIDGNNRSKEQMKVSGRMGR